MRDERRRDYEMRAAIALLIQSVREAVDVPRAAIRQRLERCRHEIDDMAGLPVEKCERIARGGSA